MTDFASDFVDLEEEELTMKRFVVMHDYHTEGWQIVAETDTLLEAVEKREEYIEGAGGGRTSIFEYLSPMLAYSYARTALMQHKPEEGEA